MYLQLHVLYISVCDSETYVLEITNLYCFSLLFVGKLQNVKMVLPTVSVTFNERLYFETLKSELLTRIFVQVLYL